MDPANPAVPSPSHHVPIIIKKPFGGTNSPCTPGTSSGAVRRPGVFPSIRYGQQVISTGIPSLDSYIGNGYPIGSIVVIRDIFPCPYADMILKCFIAEGATYNHHIFIKSGGPLSSSTFAKQLPSLVSKLESSQAGIGAEGDNLKIAWRYKDNSPLPTTLSTRGRTIINKKGHQKLTATKFEFTKKCSAEELSGQRERVTISNDNADSQDPFNIDNSDLMKEIVQVAKEFYPSHKSNSFLRIALSHCEDVFNAEFMASLRAIVRHTDSCAVLSVSDLKDTYDNKQCVIEHYADYVVEVQSILDDVKKKQLGDIDGLCDIKKMDCINSMRPIEKPKDLGFAFHKKRIVFQELHLQPEDETTAQREVTSKSKAVSLADSASTTTSCGGSTVKGKSIEF